MYVSRGLAVLLVSLFIATTTHAQTIGPLRRANAPGQFAQECAVAAGRTAATANEVVVAWHRHFGSVGTRFSVTHDGGITWPSLGQLLDVDGVPGPDMVSDSFLAVDPNGRFWLVGNPGRVAWKEQGANDFTFSYSFEHLPPLVGIDKPVLAIGPAPGNPILTQYYIGFVANGGDTVVCDAAWIADATQPLMGPTAWEDHRVQTPPPANYAYSGSAGGSVVLDSGRVLIVYRGACSLYSPELPYVVRSLDAGLTWLPNLPPVIVADGSGIVQTKSTDTPSGIEHTRFPSVAVDRAVSPNDVYVAFYGRAVRDDHTIGDRNSDIYICRSTDQGESFDGLPGPDLVQLTDATLGLVPSADGRGPDQLTPAIVVDHCGGVNVMFYDNRNDFDLNDEYKWLDVYWVRITGFGTASQNIQQARLTPTSFRLPIPSDPIPDDVDFLGHYQTLARGGAGNNKAIYAAFIATAVSEPPVGQWDEQNCYLRKITNFCLPDTNLSGGAEEDDITLFVNAFNAAQAGGPNASAAAPAGDGGEGEPAFNLADMNRDGVVDGTDYDLFWDGFLHLAAEEE
jgi:hypothetical protein